MFPHFPYHDGMILPTNVFAKDPPSFPLPPENQLREVGISGNLRDCKGSPCQGELDTGHSSWANYIYLIWVFSKKIGILTQNGSWFINNGKLLLLGTPFFRKHPYYTKIIPKPQVLGAFFGGDFPLEWPTIGRNFYLWGQETPRPPARVPMRYTKRSCWKGESSDPTNCSRWKPDILVTLVVCLGHSFWAGWCFCCPYPFWYERREQNLLKNRGDAKNRIYWSIYLGYSSSFCVCVCVFFGR